MATLPLAWVRSRRRPRGGRRIAPQVWAAVMFSGRRWWTGAVWLAICAMYVHQAVVRVPAFDRVGHATITHAARWGTVDHATVFTVEYAFSDATGARHAGTSYGSDAPWSGELHDVEYLSTDPERSRLVDMRTQPYDHGVATLLAAMAMVAWLATRLLVSAARLRIVRFGDAGRATVLACTRRRRELRWRVELAVAPDDERHTLFVDRELAGEVAIVRDRRRVVVLDALPGRPWLDGDALVGNAYALPVYLVAPAIIVALIAVHISAIIG